MFRNNLILGCALAALAGAPAYATQFTAEADIFNGTGYGAIYAGPAGFAPMSSQAYGAVFDGGNGAFDAYGFYNAGTAGLSQTRQVDLLSGNVFRFYDSFTNTSAQAITTTLNFFGNLGSDGDEMVSSPGNGVVVSCQDDGTGNCTGEPALALVSSNEGVGTAAITPDRYNARFTLTIGAGQTVSLLNYAFLASDVNGTGAADLALAATTGLALQSAPRTDGLSRAQLASVANFSVPEPASLALLAGALSLLCTRRRSRRLS